MEDCFLHPDTLPDALYYDIWVLLDRARCNLHVFPILKDIVEGGNQFVFLSNAQPTPCFLRYIREAALRDSHVVQLSDFTVYEESEESEDVDYIGDTIPDADFLSYGDGIEVSIDEHNLCFVRVNSRRCVVKQ